MLEFYRHISTRIYFVVFWLEKRVALKPPYVTATIDPTVTVLIRDPGMNQWTPRLPRAYCEISAHLGVTIKILSRGREVFKI